MDHKEKLRYLCNTLRVSKLPLSDIIPTLQATADYIQMLEAKIHTLENPSKHQIPALLKSTYIS